MKAKLDGMFGREPQPGLFLGGVASLLLLLLVGTARADTTNFTGDFAAAFWTAQPQAGSIFFTNDNSELILAGPSKPSSETASVEPITYDGPVSSGLVTDGTVAFDWQYDSPFGLDDAAYFTWTPPGGSPVQVLLAQGAGAGLTDSFSIQLVQGSTFSFVLFTDTPANKIGGSLMITNFQFQTSVPEPSTIALVGVGSLLFAGAHRRKTRR